MYYKIISDGKIIDACDGLIYVRFQEKNQMWLTCAEEKADGILSSDGEDIYLLGNHEHDGGLLHVSCTEISEVEYNELVEELVETGAITDDGDTYVESEDYHREPVKKSVMLQRLEALEQQNTMLTECLLEISEIVYG